MRGIEMQDVFGYKLEKKDKVMKMRVIELIIDDLFNI